MIHVLRKELMCFRDDFVSSSRFCGMRLEAGILADIQFVVR